MQFGVDKTIFDSIQDPSINNSSTPEPRYSKRARQTPFVYYIKSFTISRHNKK